MELILLLITFFVFLLLGVPVAMTMFGASLIYILLEPTIKLANVTSKVLSSVSSSSALYHGIELLL